MGETLACDKETTVDPAIGQIVIVSGVLQQWAVEYSQPESCEVSSCALTAFEVVWCNMLAQVVEIHHGHGKISRGYRVFGSGEVFVPKRGYIPGSGIVDFATVTPTGEWELSDQFIFRPV